MPEPSYDAETSNQSEWRMLLRDAEQRIEVLRVAIEDLRSLLGDLSLMVLEAPVIDPPSYDLPAYDPPARYDEPDYDEPVTYDPPASYDRPASPVESEASESTETSDSPSEPAAPAERIQPLSPWGGLRDDGFFTVKPPAIEQLPSNGAPEDVDPAREEVRRAVEMARAEIEAGSLEHDDEALWQADEGEPEPPAMDQAERDEVRRAVEMARAELEALIRTRQLGRMNRQSRWSLSSEATRTATATGPAPWPTRMPR